MISGNIVIRIDHVNHIICKVMPGFVTIVARKTSDSLEMDVTGSKVRGCLSDIGPNA